VPRFIHKGPVDLILAEGSMQIGQRGIALQKSSMAMHAEASAAAAAQDRGPFCPKSVRLWWIPDSNSARPARPGFKQGSNAPDDKIRRLNCAGEEGDRVCSGFGHGRASRAGLARIHSPISTNKAALFGKRNEIARRHEAALGMNPPRPRLETDRSTEGHREAGTWLE